MKRSNRRNLRDVPDVDYREKDESDDFLEAVSEEEGGSSEEPDEHPEAVVSTPFRFAPPRLLIEGASFEEFSLDSVTEDFHSAVNCVEQSSQDSDVQQSSVESEAQTVVEGGLSHQSSQSSSRESSRSSSGELLQAAKPSLNVKVVDSDS